jgi:hypothetical protein
MLGVHFSNIKLVIKKNLLNIRGNQSTANVYRQLTAVRISSRQELDFSRMLVHYLSHSAFGKANMKISQQFAFLIIRVWQFLISLFTGIRYFTSAQRMSTDAVIMVFLIYLINIYLHVVHLSVDRDSSVGIVTSYGLDGPGIESRWGARFSAPVQTGSGAHAASCSMDN